MAKSTTAVNLMAAARRCDASTRGTLIDLDIEQEDAKDFAASLDGVAFLDALPKRFSDGITIIDTPPTSAVSAPAMARSDLVLIPVTPAAISLKALSRTFVAVRDVFAKNPKLRARVVFTRVDGSQCSQGIMTATRELSEWTVCDTVIPFRRAEFEKAASARRPVVGGKGAGAQAYTALWQEIKGLHNGN